MVGTEFEDEENVTVGKCWVDENEFCVVYMDDVSVTESGLVFVISVTVDPSSEMVIDELGLVIVVLLGDTVDCDDVE